MKLIIELVVLSVMISPIKLTQLIDRKIIGGWEVKISQFPHVVRINYETDEEYSHVCGGSIIDQLWILTAAHCIFKHDEPYIQIVFGMDKFRPNPPKFHTRKILFHLKHEKYNSTGDHDNDIALIKLNKRIPLTRTSESISFVPNEYIIESNYSIFVGFFDKDGDDYPERLTALNVQLIDPKSNKCQLHTEWELKELLCGIWKPYEGASNGDSGGGLFTLEENGERILIGVGVSFVFIRKNFVSMHFSKISYYSDWIIRTIDRNS